MIIIQKCNLSKFILAKAQFKMNANLYFTEYMSYIIKKIFMTKEPIIFVGTIAHLFNKPAIETITTLKFLLTKNTEHSPTQILLMKEFSPYEFHAEALLFHMKKNNLNEIIVKGGGKICFNFVENKLSIFGTSYAFKSALKDEIEKICKECWPGYEILANKLRDEMTPIEVDGKIYSIKDVEEEVSKK